MAEPQQSKEDTKDIFDLYNGHLETSVYNGFVRLIDVMPRVVSKEAVESGIYADEAIVKAARVSYAKGTKKRSTDEGLIRYLMRNWHTSPFEMIEFKFHLKMPIFIARQWIRHRTASLNEISGRYSVMYEEFYRPEEVRAQAADNKQGSSGRVEDQEVCDTFNEYLDQSEKLYEPYEKSVNGGVSKEVARIGLPLSLMTEFYWKIDLHNLFHFLQLRMDKHAQEEIRQFAKAIFDFVLPVCPVSAQAFLDYRMNAISLSDLEIRAIRDGSQKLDNDNKRELGEFKSKLEKLGLQHSENQ